MRGLAEVMHVASEGVRERSHGMRLHQCKLLHAVEVTTTSTDPGIGGQPVATLVHIGRRAGERPVKRCVLDGH